MTVLLSGWIFAFIWANLGEGKSVGDEPNQRTHTKFSSFDPRPSNQNENQNRKNQGLQNQGKKQDKNPHFLVPELEESDLGVRKVASASKKMPTLLKPSRQDPLLKGPPLVEPPVPPSVSPISSNESFLGQAKRVFKKAVAFLTGEPYSEVMDETQLSSSIMGMKNQNQNREILLSVGPDGITAADGPSLFEKVSMRYKVYRPALIMGE